MGLLSVRTLPQLASALKMYDRVEAEARSSVSVSMVSIAVLDTSRCLCVCASFGRVMVMIDVFRAVYHHCKREQGWT